MRLRQNIIAGFGILFILFVAMASVWGSHARAQSTDQMRMLGTLGFASADFCGTLSAGHDHCPLCRLLDDAPIPTATLSLTDCLAHDSDILWPAIIAQATKITHAIHLARAPPFQRQT